MAIRKLLQTAALFVLSSQLLVSQPQRAPYAVTAIGHSSDADVTTVAIEVPAAVEFRSVRLHNPERLYIDVLDTQPRIGPSVMRSQEVRDSAVDRIRVAPHDALTTRVVLDLTSAGVTTFVMRRQNPDRIVIQVRNGSRRTTSAEASPPPPAPSPRFEIERTHTPVSPTTFSDKPDSQAKVAGAVDPQASVPESGSHGPTPETPQERTAVNETQPPTPETPQNPAGGNVSQASSTPANPIADTTSLPTRDVQERVFEVDLFGDASFFRSIESGIGTRFVPGAGGGIRFVENLYSHWGLEESLGYSANNLKLLNPVMAGAASTFGVREYSFAFNYLFYMTGRNKPIRPFLTAGAGAAYFHPTAGAVLQAQTLPNAFGSAVTLEPETKLQFNYGGGVRWKVAQHVGLSIEARGLLSKNPSFGLSCCACSLISSCRWLLGLELIGAVTFHWGAREATVPSPPVVVIPSLHRFTPGKIRGAASVCAGSPVVLASDASDGGGSPLTFHWTVNGQPAGGNTRQLTFTPDHPGEYEIQLEVIGGDVGASETGQLSFSVRALDCSPKPAPPCCSLDVACSSVAGELAVGGTAPLHVTTIGSAVDKLHYNWSATEGHIENPNSGDAIFDATGISFPASYQAQTKIITVRVTVIGEENISKSCQTQITIKKEPEPVHYDVVFAAERSRVNNCAKRFLLERLYPELSRSYRGYKVYLVGHREAGETTSLDRERALNVAAVLTSGKGVCGKFDPLRVSVGWLGVAETPYITTPCALSTEPPVAERGTDHIDYADPRVKDRRVEIWLVPEGQTLPLAVPNVHSVPAEVIDRMGCPR